MNWRQIRTNIVLVGGSQLLQKLVGFLVIAIMTRHLAREQMGEFFLAAAIGTLAAQATELGTSRHLIRSAASDRAGALGHLSQIVSLRLPVMVLTFVVVNVACFVVKPSLSDTLLLVSLYLLLQDLAFSFSAFFVGLERYGYRVTIELLGQVLLAGLTLLLVSLGGGFRAILWAYVVAHASALAVTYWLVRSTHGPLHLRWSMEAARGVVRQSLPVFGVTLLDTAHFKAGTVMLGFLRPLSTVASYEAAYRLFEVSRLGIRPVALIFYPICVALAARHDWPELRRLFRKLTRTSLLIGSAATLVVVAAAGYIVPIVFGPRYSDSVPLVRVLFLAAPTLFTGVLTVFLVHTLHLELLAIRLALGCIAANVLLNALAIPLWGPIGAAWVTLCTQTIWTVWLVVAVLRRLRAMAEPVVELATPEEESYAV
jgi:O-antigen/teichoic acid export membrane protein